MNLFDKPSMTPAAPLSIHKSDENENQHVPIRWCGGGYANGKSMFSRRRLLLNRMGQQRMNGDHR